MLIVTNLSFDKSYNESWNVAYGKCDNKYFNASNETGEWKITCNEKHFLTKQKKSILEDIKQNFKEMK
jgi:hypothetical protein